MKVAAMLEYILYYPGDTVLTLIANISANITLRKMPLGEDINKNMESCCLKFPSNWLSRLGENSESICLPHSQRDVKCARTSHTHTCPNWAGQNNCQEVMTILT